LPLRLAPGGCQLRFATDEAARGWEELRREAPGNARLAFDAIEADPSPTPPTGRQHPLKDALSTGAHGGQELPQWQ